MKHLFKKDIENLFGGVSYFGLSRDGLAVFVDAVSRLTDSRVLFVTKNEGLNKGLYRQMGFFKNTVLFYPEPPKGESVPGFQAAHNLIRSQALICLSKKKNVVCLVSEKAASLPIINKKIELKNLSVEVGKKLGRDFFCEKLKVFGFKAVDSVYNPGEISVRGDVVDVFPENIAFPLRLSFDFEILESLSAFNLDTQKSTNSFSTFVFNDLVGSPVEHGRSLLEFVCWDLIVNIICFNDSFNLVVGAGDKKTVGSFNEPIFGCGGKYKLKDLVKNNPGNTFYVYYTNKKREKKIKKRGGVPVRGYIKKGFVTNREPGFFVPDSSPQRKKLSGKTHKPIKNNHLGCFSSGDYVVHILHGVGVFQGLVVRGARGFEKEHIKIVYKNDGVLYVPINNASLIHKYQGFGGEPRVNRLGGGGWRSSVSRTKKDIELVSDSLVSIYSSRKKPRSFVYEKHGHIDAAIKKSFPYKETKDQKKSILAVLGDLEKKQPMDRLVCGDVGFGKTEVALRAVVRVAASTKQSVFLCPTTVLSDQHFITSKERLSPLGVRVALLSRFQTKKMQNEVLFGLLSGNIDFVIGTHRLLSEDVVIPSLGLLIIDEEHRFGVKHKEKIRALKAGVDVLSLSATPIPRTLQQSLLGIRDISRIETPPTTRKPIATVVEFFSWRRSVEVIEEELLRGGQVYFLNNKIQSIPHSVETLRGFFPKEKIEYIHGQQENSALEKNLLGFFNGKISILVCSTIIESGLDVSNANCIIVTNPQNLGLSQLYQIRGRVGRGSRQAHCYLFVPKKTKLSEKAYRRLKTIERHTSLGSGYSIANKDLDIRGAGSVFGYKQSGQIARIGLEYYNSLLKKAVNKKIGSGAEVVYTDVLFFGKALIPKHYVSNEGDRLSFYIKINTAETRAALLETKNELVDRFGKTPAETNNFINLAFVRLLYQKTISRTITINKASVVFEIPEKHILKHTANRVLGYKNASVINKRFQEGPSALLVIFQVFEGFDWFDLLFDCSSLFMFKN